MELAGARILITGATGFIGGHLAERLAREQGVKVRGLVRDLGRAEPLRALGIELAQGDLGDPASLARAADGCTAVIHAAAQVSALPRRELFELANVAGTENMLGAAAGAGVRRFLHFSSIAVFGLPRSGEINDQSPRRPCGDAYCDTKFAAEEAVMRFEREGRLSTVIFRPSAVYGPGSAHWSIIPLKRAKKGKLFVVAGGSGLLNYVYIQNVVDAVLLALEDDRAAGQTFIVNDGATSWRDYYAPFARMAGRENVPSVPLGVARAWVHWRNFLARLRRESYRVPANALGFLVGSAVYRQSNLEQKLGFRSRVGLEEGMERTEAWFRKTGLL